MSDNFHEDSPEIFDTFKSLSEYKSISKTDGQSFVAQIKMQNLMMMYKRVTCHPYLIHFPLKPNTQPKELLIDESIIEHSGKMRMLDAMLKKLKEEGHKVTRYLNIHIKYAKLIL